MVNGGLLIFQVGWFSNVIVASVVLAGCDSAAQQMDWKIGSSPHIQMHGWQMHTDLTYRFAVEYPNDYVILKEGKFSTTTQPPTVQRIRFQRKDIAASQFADLEPPALTVQVFLRSSGRSLHEWLNLFGLLPQGSEISSVQAVGAIEGLRVVLRQQVAPNEFVYFSTEKYVYRLIVFGPGGEKILASFRLI